MKATIVGNYLDPDGLPVLSTRVPTEDENHIGGLATALGWTGRWVKAASSDVQGVFVHYADGGWRAYSLIWDHIRTRHVALPGQWIVWDGTEFRVETVEAFAAYMPVEYDVDTEETP